MLRASIRRSQLAASKVTAAQWVPARYSQARYAIPGQRSFADSRKPDETVFPGSQSSKAADAPTPIAIDNNLTATVPSTLGDRPTVDPKATPTLGTGTAAVAPPPSPTPAASAVPPPPSALPAKKPRRWFRRFLLYSILLSVLGYGGGVYYSLHSDNFHDFFTEYVPFGEDAVGYFEEREFRRRFQGTAKNSPLHPQVRGENKVTIPSKSGTSARAVSDLGSAGRHTSALEENTPKPISGSAKPAQEAKAEKPTDSHSHDLLPKSQEAKVKTEAPTKKAVSEQAKAAAPSTPAALIDNISIKEGTEPAVQDLVKILNNIITVINADNASGKYSSTITQAKQDLGKVIEDITTLKAVEKKASDDKVKAAHAEFDDAAKNLVSRLESEMKEQETHFKEEYEAERERLAQSYNHRLEVELDSAQKVYEQRVKNELAEQSIALQRKFAESIRSHVEAERDGRLSKLNDLSNSVSELEKLTGAWNDVVDANLKTQHLVVAVEAVRASIEHAEKPTPFLSELAALKEVANDSPVVSAAIASINPTAYQRGIPTPAQIIDRFRRVASEVRKASLLPENAGVASHLASAVLSKVMFKKQGLPIGDDVESVLTRTEVLLEEGDLDGAAREMNGLNGWAKLLAKDWLSDTRKVLEVRQALDVMSTEARLQSLLVD
ncbi:hypothetical protein EJ05DRAFT_96636 [Pseudovirgaria hyperparasitica]|uniref:MICOS complex subunit MIC60 n=1 Tax=Pseudovirgaria hyperparasitica TaxID=470096 RepID=A0A6A6W2W5_9PEZI|nr:uncharacterized protein EJ05DRAFT_96636 [Pseudovirgaria hyperparasitica]KAF2756300.1 hypothetical protein EJ05DRAFT_96636 [Pseudovirgaria hyperparasitica]